MSRPAMTTRTSSNNTSHPKASVPRMIFSPVLRLFRRLNIPLPTNIPTSPSHLITPLNHGLSQAIARFDLSTDPRKSLALLASHKWSIANTFPLMFLAGVATFALWIMGTPGFPLKLLIPSAYAVGLLLPVSQQFVWPATPVFTWLITFFSARFIPTPWRPNIHVALLPALEAVLYGANISDLQTRYTNAVLDVMAWIPYGVLHYLLPFLVAGTLWAMGPKGAVQYWGKAFGWMNVLGVLTQLIFPCAAPWYEIIHGLTPATYAMSGSPGGLMRIDKVFHSSTYTNAFGSQPLVFGAFPSLHSGCAVMEALFLSHFFPSGKILYWTYTGILWWATMYLSHHYLIDLVGGACLSVIVFYATMPEVFKDSDAVLWTPGRGEEGYEMVPKAEDEESEVDIDEEIRRLEESDGPRRAEDVETGDAEGSKSGGKGKKSVSWGEDQILHGKSPRISSSE